MTACIIRLSFYVHTHTFNSKHPVKPKPPSPPVPEVRRDDGDKQTHGVPQPSTNLSRNFFTVNKPTITFCLQIPLRLIIGLAGSPLSSPSRVPVQRSHPSAAIDHGPPQLPPRGGQGSLPSRFLSFVFDLCHRGRVHLEPCCLDAQFTEIFLFLTCPGNHL